VTALIRHVYAGKRHLRLYAFQANAPPGTFARLHLMSQYAIDEPLQLSPAHLDPHLYPAPDFD
jgi:hypothetical protein